MTLKLSEAIKLGSLVLRRQRLGGESGSGCALQMAAVAAGRPDLAYGVRYDGFSAGLNYSGVSDLFNLTPDQMNLIWQMHDEWDHGHFVHSIDDIVKMVEEWEVGHAVIPFEIAEPEVEEQPVG